MVDEKTIHKLPVLEQDKVSRYLSVLQYNLISFGRWEQQVRGQSFEDVLGHFKFIYVAQGDCSVEVNSTNYTLDCGDIVLFAPFVTYRASCPAEHTDLVFYYLHFDVDPAEKRKLLTLLLGLRDIAIYRGLMAAPLIGGIGRVYRHTEARKPGAYYGVGNLLQTTILAALATTAPQDLLPLASEHPATAEELIVRSCVAYIDANLDKSISVQDLCTHVSASQSYLYRCFSSVLHSSTKDFILRHKLQHLTVRLLKENRPLKELAFCYGFSSVNHLSTVFKKYYGCPPTQYRQQKL